MRIWVSDCVDWPERGGIDGFYVSEEAAIGSVKSSNSAFFGGTAWLEERDEEDLVVLRPDPESEVFWRVYPVEVVG